MTDVCMPWRPQPDRIPAFDRCCDYWNDHGFVVITADSDPSYPFLCNQARNNAVRIATSDVVIIADADTLPNRIGRVHQAVDLVRNGVHDVVWPFDTYRHIPGDAVDTEDPGVVPFVREYRNSPAGIIVVNRQKFWEIGGFDEGFTPGQWGFDDSAFALAARTLLRTYRLPGVVFSFDHPVDGGRDMSDDNRNKYRYTLYARAFGNRARMRELAGCPVPSE